MTNSIRFEENGVEIHVLTNTYDPSNTTSDAGNQGFQKAGIGSAIRDAKDSVAKTFQESLQVVTAVATSFSKLLENASKKPSTAEVTFGIEASGQADVMVIGQISGKSNFQVKMTWKFDNPNQ